MSDFWKALTLVLVIFAFVAVLTHASGFSTATGSFFGGLSTLGSALTGA